MKKFAIMVIVVITILTGSFALTGCSTTASENQTTVEHTMKLQKNSHFTVWTDPDTNVQYILFESSGRAGHSVRYNSDGTIMTAPVE